MPDTTTTVKTVDIQLLDADRSNATTIKLDNPKDDLTREQVSSAMQPAFTNGWFLCNNGNVAMYLGDVTINQSIKTRLDGADFYVTPSSLTLTNSGNSASGNINVSGAVIQGYNISGASAGMNVKITINNNGLTANVRVTNVTPTSQVPTGDFTVTLIIQGQSIVVPCTIPAQ